MRPFFRPEAQQAQVQSWLGRIQLIRPLSLSVITLGVCLTVLAVAAFFATAQYTRKASTSGVLVPDLGLIRLVPVSAGTVLERRVVEGQAVQAGDLLFVLALERPLLGAQAQAQVQRSLDQRQQSLRSAALQQRSLTNAQLAALDRRLVALARELQQTDNEMTLQAQRLALAQQSLARLEALQSAQFIAAAQVQTKNEELLAVQASSQSLARQRAALERERAELEGQRSALPLQAQGAAGGIERDLALLSREAAEQDADRRVVVRAPQAGVVSAVLADVGQSVSPASALANLVPLGATLQAHLFAPSSSMGFVRPQQTVRLRFEAYPYQKFGAWRGQVVHVSRTPLAVSELAALALPLADKAEPMFRITVVLDAAAPQAAQTLAQAEPLALSAGMRLQADVLLERRRLVEWLFEPLIGLWRRA